MRVKAAAGFLVLVAALATSVPAAAAHGHPRDRSAPTRRVQPMQPLLAARTVSTCLDRQPVERRQQRENNARLDALIEAHRAVGGRL